MHRVVLEKDGGYPSYQSILVVSAILSPRFPN
jgi:hypothetical protein